MSADTTDIPRLDQVSVRARMHAGIITCTPDTSVTEIARLLADHGMHCVVVSGIEQSPGAGRSAWGVISDMDLVRALAGGDASMTAGRLAATEPLTVDVSESVETAAQMMVEHDISHLLVVDASGAVGVLSTLDVARAAARPD